MIRALTVVPNITDELRAHAATLEDLAPALSSRPGSAAVLMRRAADEIDRLRGGVSDSAAHIVRLCRERDMARHAYDRALAELLRLGNAV